ncbi:frizzled/Smoothened family membrane region domain-containing protein [Ditylenchus destructor]|nr:frizzled/Smoothened family membrane region domain-containing protein [Ditylenchus destructor]
MRPISSLEAHTIFHIPSFRLSYLFLGLFSAIFAPSPVIGSIFDKPFRCRPIDIPLCKDIPYNKTIFPNPYFESDEQNLQTQTEHFKPLIKTKCNPHVQFFICSAFAPMCPDQMPQAVTSCRSVCEEVRRDCIKILQEFDIQWPAILNCSRFPEAPNLCMQPSESQQHSYISDPIPAVLSPPPSPGTVIGREIVPSCPTDLINLDPTDANGNCAFRCDKATMFPRDKKEQAKLWISMWAIINIVVTLFTVLSFLIDSQRFRFPERSIFYISLCYLCYSLPYLTRLVLSFDQTACSHLPTGQKFLVQSGQDNVVCVLSFLFNYYFGMAGALWWLMLTFTWYLSAAKKWVQEEIEKRSSYLHLFAWGIPALLAISVLITHKVDASELTGVCSVGNSNPWTLLGFVLLPKVCLVLTGLCFIVAGFSAMCRERECFRRRGTDTSKLEKFMFKMGSFSTLYVIPALVIAICDCYHVLVLMRWHPATIGCKLSGGVQSGACVRPFQPQAEIYVLNVSMTLTVGLATGLWIFSPKTLSAWRRFLCCHNEYCPPGALSAQKAKKYTAATAIMHHCNNGSSIGSPRGAQASLLTTSRPLIQGGSLSSHPPLPPPPSQNAMMTHRDTQGSGVYGHRHSIGNGQNGHYIPMSLMSTNPQTYTANGMQSQPNGANNKAYMIEANWKASKVI